MTVFGWILFGLGFLAVAFFTAVGIGRVCRINIEGPKQRARRVMRRGAQLDIDDAIARALELDKPEIARW